jgi:thymidylate synthase (FAD)
MTTWIIVCIIVGGLIAISALIVMIGDAIETAQLSEQIEEQVDRSMTPEPEEPPYIERREVLDGGYVELIDFMGDDVDATVDAARVSFDRKASEFSREANLKLMDYLDEHGHTSPLEMTEFKFRIKAPVLVWWQWVRHRMASYNFKSGRYVPFDETEVYRPALWRSQSKSNKQGSEGVMSLLDTHDFNLERDYIYDQCFDLYSRMLAAGVAKEQARLVLPFGACYYEAIVKMNARSLKNFLGLRLGKDAQSEIRWYAEAVEDILKTTHPETFDR